MRYYSDKPDIYSSGFGIIYECNHTVYSRCTLYLIGNKGLSVIQQRYDKANKMTYWTEIDSWIENRIYLNSNFKNYFNDMAKEPTDGVYPTVTVRQIMWALRIKPLKKEKWETVFDRNLI